MSDCPAIGFVAIDPDIAREVANPGAVFVKALQLETESVRHLMAGVIGMTPPKMLEQGLWGGFFVFDVATRHVVGTCAFKSPPDDAGVVEIAYYTFKPYEGQGYAIAMACELVRRAGASSAARTVVAHTLIGESASTHVLERVGFRRLGEAVDPHDGPVWRWALEIGA